MPTGSPSPVRRPWTLPTSGRHPVGSERPSPAGRATTKEGTVTGEKKEGKGMWRGGYWQRSAQGRSPLGDTPSRSRQPRRGRGRGRGREEGRRAALLDSGSRFGSRLVWARRRSRRLSGPEPRALGPIGAGEASSGLRAAFPYRSCHRQGRHSDGKQRRRKKKKKGKKKKARRGGVGWPPAAIDTGPVAGGRHTRLLDEPGRKREEGRRAVLIADGRHTRLLDAAGEEEAGRPSWIARPFQLPLGSGPAACQSACRARAMGPGSYRHWGGVRCNLGGLPRSVVPPPGKAQ